MNITAKVSDNKVKVTGTVKGVRRQMTVPTNNVKGTRGNAGSAAGQFAAKFLTVDEQKGLDTAILTGRVIWTDHGDGKVTFETP